MKVLLLGAPPPPLRSDTTLEAIHYRTWQFLQPLLTEGHEVCLCVDGTQDSGRTEALGAALRWESIPFGRPLWMPKLQHLHDELRPDAIVAVDFYPALWATRLRTDAPIWMDLYGDPLTIMQVARYRVGNDQGIGTAVQLMQRLLARGDMFSTCGLLQKHMLVGELAMAGRLNGRNFGHELVRPIYPGALPVEWNSTATNDAAVSEPSLPVDAFVVLWCGGYNTWTDVDTLHRGLELAMAGDARLHFVSVGASTYAGRDTVYDRFAALCQQSRRLERYHLLGWRPWREIPYFYRLSHVGVSIDALHYETLYGTRTRLLEMLAYGLPVISSEGCELSYLISQKQVGYSFANGDAEGLAEAILSAARDPARLEALRTAALRVTQGEWSFYETTADLRSWVTYPTRAPDNLSGGQRERIQRVKYGLRTLARMLLWQVGLSGQRRAK